MRGQQYYVICAACHGERAEGIEALGAPRLSQLPVSYLVRQLENFRHGRRGSHADDSFGQQMALVAAMIPDEDVERSVAEYIQGLRGEPPQEDKRRIGEGNPAAGQDAFKVCVACHGDRAQGIEQMDAPPLSGQSATYLVRQLEKFATSRRGRAPDDAPGARMASIAAAVDAKTSAEDLIAYISSLD